MSITQRTNLARVIRLYNQGLITDIYHAICNLYMTKE